MVNLFNNLLPAENATLWRFMDFFKFIDLITSNELTLVNLTVMKDPFEGIIHSNIKMESIDIEGNLTHEDDNEIRSLLNHATRQILYISCWHENRFESAGMWDLYGNDKGIAIKTSVNKLKDAINFSSYKEMDLLKINYYSEISDYYIPNRDASHIYTGLINKRASFEHEKEVRLIWHPRDYDNNSSVRKIKVNLKELVDTIYVSPLLDDWQFCAIKRLIDRFGLEIIVKKSELYELR